MDPDCTLRQANINKKSHWRDIKKVIDNADVILYVLDARDPMGTLNVEVDELIHSNSKKVIYILNKTDLVPPENAKAW
jgi:nuclear GTP-binding protein